MTSVQDESTILPVLQGQSLVSVDSIAVDRTTVSPLQVDDGAESLETLAYLQYTSGSTATPRGVMVTHRNILAQCEAICAAGAVDGNSRSLCWLPYFHDYGLVHGILAPFYAGVPAYLMSPLTFLRRPLRWLDALGRFGITHSGAPNFAYDSCVKALASHSGWTGDLANWKVASCGAEPVHWDTVEAFARAFEPHGFSLKAMTPAYGLAEATLVVSTKTFDRDPQSCEIDGAAFARHTVRFVEQGTNGAKRVVSCGAPVAGMEVRIVDPDSRKECPSGVIGEIWVAGSSVARGYWAKPAETSRTFGAMVGSQGTTKYLRTGDLGFIHNGEVVITGRIKDLIIVNGRNVYPQDIEWTVGRAYAGLKEGGSAVVAVAEGHAESIVVLQEVERNQSLDVETVAAAIRQAVMEEHEVTVSIVALLRSGGLPKTSSGKIQRQSSKDAFIEGTLAVLGISRLSREDAGASHEEEAGPLPIGAEAIEGYLQRMVARHLRAEQALVSVTQPLAALGIDSLAAGEIKGRLEDRFQVEVSFAQLLTDWSIKELAAYLDQHRGAGTLMSEGHAPTPGSSGDSPAFPLSVSQRRLWFAQEFEADRCVNNIPVAVQLEGPLDVEVLEASLRFLIRRHEALRTAFGVEQGEPYQIVVENPPFALSVHDFKTVSPADRARRQAAILKALATHQFNLAEGFPIQAALLILSAGSHLLAITFHHLVIDSRSIRIFTRELAEVYAALQRGQEPLLPRLPLSYRACLAWNHVRLPVRERARQLVYWKQRLADLPPPVQVLPDRARLVPSPRPSAQVAVTLTASQVETIDQLARTVGVTRFMVFASALAVLLHRYSGSTDLVIGMPVLLRRGEALEGMVGCFINTVLLRVGVKHGQTVEELLRSVRDTVVQANDHRDLPFDEVVRAFSPQSFGDRGVPFHIIAVSDEDPTPELQLDGVTVRRVHVERSVTSVDLAFVLHTGFKTVQLSIEYDTGLYESQTVESMLARLSTVMTELAASTQCPLSQITLLTGEERSHLLKHAQGPRVELPDNTIHSIIETRAAQRPHAIAVMTRQGHITYEELERRANQLAHYLRRRGIGRGMLVGLCIERSIEVLVGLLGILKSGAAYVPLDYEYPRERLGYLVHDSGIALLLTQSHLHDRVPIEESRLVCLDTDHDLIEACECASPGLTAGPDDLAYVMYTSGSMGEPKGVAVTHRNVIASTVAREHYYREPVERFLLASSLSFDGSVAGLFWTLFGGGALVMPAESDQRNPDALANWIAQFRTTHLACVPTLYDAILKEASREKLTSLRVVILGGEALSTVLVERHHRLLPHADLFNEYGPTETTVWASAHRTVPNEEGLRVPIGRPIGNAQVYVLDCSLQPVPIGVVGELYIGGAGVARGYWNRPELTVSHFVDDPFAPRGRLYRTGDYGRVKADGVLEFIGRRDEQVNLRGYRIELAEIDKAVQTIPEVEKAATVLQRPPLGGVLLGAHVTLKTPAVLTPSELRARAQDVLPSHMVPSNFTIHEALPLTPSGKIDKRALLALSRTARPDEFPSTVPRDQIEASLMEMWGQILHRRIESVHQSFFELGGHSLLATQLASRIRDVFGVEIALRKLFELPTIVAIADVIRSDQRRGVTPTELSPIVPVSRAAPIPCSYSQQRMWFVQQLAPESTAYNMPFTLRQFGRLNRPALRQTIDAMVARHESFRTTFRMSGQGPVQIIASEQAPGWGEISLRPLSEEQRVRQAVAIVEQEVKRPFDLEKGPLVRVLLIELDVEDHILVLTMHHIIGDQWSFGIIGKEFASLYRSLCEGCTAALPPLAIQYADYAVWQRDTLTDERLRAQSDYWTQQLNGLTTLALPTDFPRPTIQTFKGSYCSTDLPTSLIDRLAQFSAQRRATSFMTLLACFYVLLSRYANQTDIAVGVPIANRTQVAVEGLVGTFVNTLVLRESVLADQTFEELLEHVRGTALDAYAHQDFPFERLVERIQVNRDPSYPPLVQVLFNVANAVTGDVFPQGLAWSPFEIDPGASQVDLSLSIETDLARKAYLTYNTDLFTQRTAEQMLEHYKTVLHHALAHPQTKISALSLLTKSEQKRLIVDWNRTEQAFPRDLCFPELFEAQVERTPEAIALSMGDAAASYRELNAKANQLARTLRNRGVVPGVVVGLLMHRSIDSVVALLAVMKAGGCYLPLDPDFPRARIRFMMEDAEASVVLASATLAERLSIEGPQVVCLDRDEAVIGRESDHNLVPTAGPDDTAYVLYTSGSTGHPKGVEIRHRSLVNFLWSMQRQPGCTAEDTLLSVTTLSFDIVGLELYLPLMVGARVEIAGRADVTDGRRLQACIQRVRPTIMQATPATWRLLLDSGWNGDRRLKVLCGGEALPSDLAQKLLDRTAALWNMYGPTETTIWSTIAKVEPNETEITVGRPIANTEVYILNQDMQPVPIGVAGEIYIGGLGLAKGYRKRHDLTADRFVPHPFSTDPAARLYRTGDLGRYRADGCIVHLGRMDHQVKVRGFRIELGEIETVLSTHPAVRQVVVTARDDRQGFKQLVAYVVPQGAQRPSIEALRSVLRPVLPDYMVPSAFVFLDALPLTANNKIDLRSLPAPDWSEQAGIVLRAAPRTGLEMQLTALWQQVLGVGDLSIHDNFFDRGGHSLKAAQLFFHMETVFGRQLPLATLFQAPTVAELAAVLSREQWIPPWQSLVAIQPHGENPPLFLIPGVGGNVLMFAELARLLGPLQPTYGLQARGLDGVESPFTSIVETATHYVEQIRHVAAGGPYLIAGTCTGGVIAYEVARQLIAQGEPVTLIMLDTWHPDSYRHLQNTFSARLWIAQYVLSKVWADMRTVFRLPMGEWVPTVVRKARALEPLLSSRLTGQVMDPEISSEKVRQATLHAVAHYKVAPYEGTLINVVASRRAVADIIPDTRRRWPSLAKEGSSTLEIPAEDSGRLFVSPYVEVLAKYLQGITERGSEQRATACVQHTYDLRA